MSATVGAIQGVARLRRTLALLPTLEPQAERDDDPALKKILVAIACVIVVPALVVASIFGAYNLGELSATEQEVAVVLFQEGYSNAAVAAILGNMKQESGLNPQSGYPSSVACGLCQWGNGTDGSGWQSLVAWASGEGLDPLSATTQTRWLCMTLEGALNSYTGRGFFTYPNGTRTWWPERVSLDEFKQSVDVNTATEIFCNTYERPSIPAMDARKRYANEYYEKLCVQTATTANGNAIVQAAYSQLGVPYVWGGHMPFVGLDCSGLTAYCYAQAGIQIVPYTETQLAQARVVTSVDKAEPGDILYRPGHVAIYIGDDAYIHEPTPGQVCQIARGIGYFTHALKW